MNGDERAYRDLGERRGVSPTCINETTSSLRLDARPYNLLMNLALRYRPIPDSPLARWDARWKLAAIFVAVGGIAALNHAIPAAAALAIGLALLAVARLPRRWVQTRLALFALAALPFLIILPF